MHCSFDGDFREYGEDEIINNGYGTRLVGDIFSGNNPMFSFNLTPCTYPAVHWDDDVWTYYSIPSMKGNALIGNKSYEVDGWFDHEYNNFPGKMRKIKWRAKWDWLSLNLGDGKFYVSYKDKVWGTKFDGELMEKEETIFKPKYGPYYSETPVSVMKDGEKIGFGVRERTYGRPS